MIGPALRAHLIANSGVTAIVAQRVYPMILPQEPTLPAITYQVISESRDYALSGEVAPRPYVQVDAWGRTYAEAGQLGDAVCSALDAFRGSLGSILPVTEVIQRNRIDIYEEEAKQYRATLDFSFRIGS